MKRALHVAKEEESGCKNTLRQQIYILVYLVCSLGRKHTFHTFRISGAQSG